MSQQKKLEFFERVGRLRERMQLTQVEFASMLGISDEYVSQIEKGRKVESEVGRTLKILIGKLEQELQLSPTTASVVSPAPASVVSEFEMRDGAGQILTPEQWKQRAIAAEQEAERLRSAVRELVKPLSSAPLSEAQQIAKRAGDKFDRDHPKP